MLKAYMLQVKNSVSEFSFLRNNVILLAKVV